MLTVRPKNGITPDDIDFVVTLLRKICVYYNYVIEEPDTDAAHMHCLLLTKKKKFRIPLMRGLDGMFITKPELWHRKYTVNLKTWYKFDKEHEDDTYSGGWAYLAKDGQEMHSWWDDCWGWLHPPTIDDLQQYLADNIPRAQRRESVKWHTMHTYETLFEKHGLPFKTFEDVDNGLSFLAFEAREIMLPNLALMRQTVQYLWQYLNKHTEGVNQLNQKRKMVEWEEEERQKRAKKAKISAAIMETRLDPLAAQCPWL